MSNPNSGTLVESPRAHKTILDSIKHLAECGDGHYPEILRRLGDDADIDRLVSKSATWHRSCYQMTVNTRYHELAQRSFKQSVSVHRSHKETNPCTSASSTFTRSKSDPYDKTVCFFCDGQGSSRDTLHTARTNRAGQNLRDAIENGTNDKLKVKLSTAIDPHDALSIDVVYHNACWTTNVTNVIRRTADEQDLDHKEALCKVAADIEFRSILEIALRSGQVLNMGYLQDIYTNIRAANNVTNAECRRKDLKSLIQNKIPDVEFHKPKQLNKPHRVSMKETRDAAIQMAVDSTVEMDSKMKLLYNAAASLRKSISKCDKWAFDGTFLENNDPHVPTELYSFFRWVLQGPATIESTNAKFASVNRQAMSLAQTTMSMFLT